MRVLASAYACEPGRGSEHGVGWNCVRQIARFHEVWVLTRPKFRDAIEAAVFTAPLPNVHWVYLDFPKWMRPLRRRGLLHAYYLAWQVRAYYAARQLHRQHRFDLSHHLTFCNYWIPSFLAFLPIPFVWGPVGGGESTPAAFRRIFSARGKVYERARDLARTLSKFNPALRSVARRAALTLVTTEETARRVRELGAGNVYVLSEAGLSESDLDILSRIPRREALPFRILSVGNLLHLKGFELSLRAFAEFHLRFSESEYWIVGQGPEQKRMTAIARELKVSDAVRFLGSIPRPEVFWALGECDVLVHPSLHDSGGWVCLEAMAAGRPIICLDLGGPGLQVASDSGIKIAPSSVQEAIRGLGEAMESLARDPLLRARLSQAARRRVQECFLWDQKGPWTNAIYSSVVGKPRRDPVWINSIYSPRLPALTISETDH